MEGWRRRIRGICVCATSLAWRQTGRGPGTPPCRPQTPSSHGTGWPRGACWKSDTRNEIQIHLERGAQGFVQSGNDPKARENCRVGTPHSWDLQRAPGAGGGTRSGKWLWQIHNMFSLFLIHINDRNPLHKAQFQAPYLPSLGAARPLSQGNTDLSCSLRNTASQGNTPLLFFSFHLLFFFSFPSFFPRNNTGNTSNV